MQQSQKNFVAAASHELKSPLAVIMANIEVIHSKNPADPQIQTSLKTLDSECRRIAKLVQNMLLLTSADADKWTVQKKDMDTDSLLISLYEAYEPICISHSLQLILDLSEQSYPQLYTDRERVFQILSIYLDNAVCYAPKGSRIEIQTASAKKELTFFIVDHGPGITEKDKPFIFDRFYRADKSHTDKAHVGLGLSIAKELTDMLGGKIGFSDTAGGGATFFLTLPMK